jgi:hypothetical protein
MKLQYGEILDTAWKSLRDQLALVAGLTAVYCFSVWVLNLVPFLGYLACAPLGLGYVKCLMQIRKGQVIEYQDFFWGFLNFNRFLHVVLMNVLLVVGYFVGFLLLIIPGIWVVVTTAFSTQYFILKKEDAVESIQKSIEMVKGRWWNVFGFILVLVLINMGGAICLLIGLLVSIPVSTLAMIIAAEKLLASLPLPPANPAPLGESAATEPAEVTILPR